MANLPSEPGAELDGVLDRIDDGFVVLDRDWRYRYVNRAAEEYFGIPREHLLGRIVWDVFPAALGSEVEREYRRAAAGTTPVELELLSPIKKRWVAQRVFPSASGLSIYFHDVTARREAQESQRESEARFRSLFIHNLAGIFLSAPSGEVLAANPAVCRMLQRTEEEICRLGRGGVVDMSDPRAAVFMEERKRTGAARGELTLVRKDGTKFEADVSSAVFIDRHGELLTSISVHDLTERKRGEEAVRLLAAAGEKLPASLDYDETLQNLASLLVPRVADLCIVDIVEGDGLRRVAITGRELVQRETVLQPRRAGPDRAAGAGIGKVLRSGRPELVTLVTEDWLRMAARDDADLEAARAMGAKSILMVPLRARGAVTGVLSLFLVEASRRYSPADLPMVEALSDRAALAIENARLYAVALGAKRRRDEVLAVVSHDLRNPLNSILLNASVLAQQGDNTYLARIRSAATRAGRLIEDLLTASMSDAGSLAIDRRLESVAAIIEDLIQIHRPLADARRIELWVEVAPDCPAAYLDRHRVTQALSNIVGNALKFTEAGGRVGIDVRPAGAELHVTVSDTGPGIAPEDMEHLFDRFWQGHRARGADAGAGLGLAIARGCVEAHGGTIDVQSQVGLGATFTIALPLPPPPEASSRTPLLEGGPRH